MRARLALLWKGIEHEVFDIDPADRSTVVNASGQPLTPVLIHEGRVIYDSASIVRYLDANWPQGPRLFRTDREAMKSIERWELASQTSLHEGLGICFDQFFSPEVDEAQIQRANRSISEAARCLEDTLESSGDFLLGDGVSAADIAIAPKVSYALLDPSQENGHPIREFFAKHHRLEGEFERTRAWAARVMKPLVESAS